MIRFYGHLNAGMAKDEALRAAQLELIRRRASGALSSCGVLAEVGQAVRQVTNQPQQEVQ